MSFDKINKQIENHNFFNVFQSLIDKAINLRASDLLSQLKKLEENYRYMAQYIVGGFEDSELNDNISNLASELFRINELLRMESRLVDSSDIFSSTKRFMRVRKTSLSQVLDALRITIASAPDNQGFSDLDYFNHLDKVRDDIFNFTLTMTGASKTDYNLITDFVIENIDFISSAQVISALLLGNLIYFDIEALVSLYRIYEESNDVRIKARSLVAILFSVSANNNKLAYYPKIIANLTNIYTFPSSRSEIRNIISMATRYYDTERVSAKMQNEVIPELMKIKPEIIDKLKNMSDSNMIDPEDFNPEWEEIIEESGFADKIRELTEMQMEGADLMMLSFSQLKHFSFFNILGNWLLPFTPMHHEIKKNAADIISMFEDLFDSSNINLCDSDKYSFAFSLAQMPENQRKLMAGNMKAQMEQIKALKSDVIINKNKDSFINEVSVYMRDLYRFFKLYRQKKEFKDVFENPLLLIESPFLSSAVNDIDFLQIIGGFYFKNGYYDYSEIVFKRIDALTGTDYHVWEKIGFCLAKRKEFDKALQWYLKADLLNPDSIWLQKRIATTYRRIGKSNEALVYYDKVLTQEPENVTFIIGAANSYLDIGNFEKALKYFFHANYLRPDDIGIIRALAWTQFMLKNFDKSLEFYSKIENSDKTEAEDFLNSGHVNLAKGDFKNAISYYKKYLAKMGNDMSALDTALNNDIEILNNAGISSTIIRIIIDHLKFELK